MRVQIDSGAYSPVRAHETDAGMDLRATAETLIPAHGGATIHTGVHVELPEGTAGLLVSKSGLNVKHDITSTGLIDCGYSGEIVVKLHNHGDAPYMVHAGDKISQLVVISVRFEPVEIVDKISGGDRGNDGFGSSGR